MTAFGDASDTDHASRIVAFALQVFPRGPGRAGPSACASGPPRGGGTGGPLGRAWQDGEVVSPQQEGRAC
jgi:hypothetical protein